MTENHAKYVEYLHGQVRELLTNYGRTDMLLVRRPRRRRQTTGTPKTSSR